MLLGCNTTSAKIGLLLADLVVQLSLILSIFVLDVESIDGFALTVEFLCFLCEL